MRAIDQREWQSLPEQAQREIYRLFPVSKTTQQARQTRQDEAETLLFSNHSANLIEDWLDDTEDEVWK